MNLTASAILDKSEKEVLDNAHALLSCEEQWSNPIEWPNELNMPDLLPMDPSDITANNIDLHPVQDGEVQYPFDLQPFPTPLMDTLPLDSDTSRWPQLQSSARIQPTTNSENITDDPNKEMNTSYLECGEPTFQVDEKNPTLGLSAKDAGLGCFFAGFG